MKKQELRHDIFRENVIKAIQHFNENSSTVIDMNNDAGTMEMGIYSNAADAFQIWTGTGITSTPRFTIDTSGNVGIGETAPLGKLHIKEDDSGASSVRIFDSRRLGRTDCHLSVYDSIRSSGKIDKEYSFTGRDCANIQY